MEKEYQLKGLACAACAQAIEEKISEFPEVKTATVNFATAKLTIDAATEDDTALNSKIEQVVHDYEPETVIRDLSAKSPEKHPERTNLPFKKELVFLVIAILLAIAGAILGASSPGGKIAFLLSWAVAGFEVIWEALRSLSRKNWFDENFLMSLATFGAIVVGEYPEAAAVMVFYQIGEFLQDLAVDHSRRSISALMNIRPDSANLIEADTITSVDPAAVKIGALIQVNPGEKIPLDGIIEDGYSSIDTSAITGESIPREVSPGDQALSGCINLSGRLTVRVTKEFGDSTVSKILDLVENAASKKAPTERFITRFSKIYTPIVILLAALLAIVPPLVTGGDWSEWLYRGLVFMVISCPCALVVSIPLGFLGGIAKSSRMGMIVKGSNYLEALNQVSIAAFDKTGTLTEGVFTVTRIMPADDQVTESELLKIAAYAEADISHPIAKSILKAYGGEIDHTLIESLTEIPGQGIQAQIDGKQVWVGNQKLMDARQISLPKLDENGTLVHIAEEQRYLGSILIADTIKKDSAEAIRRLKQLGIQKTVLLTGDRTEVGDAVGNTLGIDQVFSSLLPDQKVAAIETLLAEKPAGSSLIFVGDGVNDAPVLARADIGIAMGKLGSDAAIEAADVVILTDEPSRLPDLIEIARRTRQIVWQNIIFTLVVKGVILLLGAMGIAGMWIAVFADVGVMLLAVLNSLRVLR